MSKRAELVLLREALRYDIETGLFYWNRRVNRRKLAGSIAGFIGTDGYRAIRLNGTRWWAHRLAWYFYYGVYPTLEIDHIDGDRSNNKITNLREVTHRENGHNRIEHRNGALVGAHYSRSKKCWTASIRILGKDTTLGNYSSALDAHNAYIMKFAQLNNSVLERAAILTDEED